MSKSNHIKVVRPGLLSTVQDAGRLAYQRFGVSVSGAMDRFSFDVANLLVGNDPGEAVLEVTLLGPALELLDDCAFAITGGDLSPLLNGSPAPMWQCLFAPKGSTLSFGALRAGARGYIAFAGGIDVPVVMGSRSTNAKAGIGGFEGRPLKAGDLLPINRTGVRADALPLLAVPAARRPQYPARQVLRVVLGPQDDYFTPEGIATLSAATYTVSKECDRMGYRLEGDPILHKTGADIISDGIAPGSVQIPGNGQPIILMADRQTTGGYTKIATVISADLPKVAQAKAGDTFCFEVVAIEQAQEIHAQAAQALEQLAKSCTVAPPPPPAPAPAVPAPPPSPAAALPAQATGAPRRFRITLEGSQYDVEVREL